MLTLLSFLACSSSPEVELVQHYVESCTNENRGCVESLRVKPTPKPGPSTNIFFSPNDYCTNFRQVGDEVQVDCIHSEVHFTAKNTYGFKVSDGKITKVHLVKEGERTLSK